MKCTKFFIIIIILISALRTETVFSQRKSNGKPAIPKQVNELLQKHACTSCHHIDKRLTGPSFTEISKRKYDNEFITNLIVNPNPSNWPQFPPMPTLTSIGKEDANKIGSWINSIKVASAAK